MLPRPSLTSNYEVSCINSATPCHFHTSILPVLASGPSVDINVQSTPSVVQLGLPATNAELPASLATPHPAIIVIAARVAASSALPLHVPAIESLPVKIQPTPCDTPVIPVSLSPASTRPPALNGYPVINSTPAIMHRLCATIPSPLVTVSGDINTAIDE